jgi:hypothetical protein
VVVVPTLIVAAVQVSPVSHLSPLGMLKLNTASLVVQTFVTLALDQAGRVVVVQASIVAASH